MALATEEVVGEKREQQTGYDGRTLRDAEAAQDKQARQGGEGKRQQEIQVVGDDRPGSEQHEELHRREVKVIRHGKVFHAQPARQADRAVPGEVEAAVVGAAVHQGVGHAAERGFIDPLAPPLDHADQATHRRL